jgi:hypothetical protein
MSRYEVFLGSDQRGGDVLNIKVTPTSETPPRGRFVKKHHLNPKPQCNLLRWKNALTSR